jgi:predicted CxxxxCH...CXXCH cytochrome family protein
MTRPTIAALAVLALGLAACGDARKAASSGSGEGSAQCVGCHGGADNQTGAPPADTAGKSDTARVSVGAHSSHVQASALAPAFACTECHPDPRFGSKTHLNGVRDVAFGALASKGTAPSWDLASATCAGTYCHGAKLGGGTNTTPVWTKVGQGQAACGACHGVPPPSPHPAVSSDPKGCGVCHPKTVDANGEIVPASAGGKHLDGAVEVVSGHDASWMDTSSPGFHAYSADQGLSSCQLCHGPTLDGAGGAPACADCHGTGWKTSCVMCHGGTDDQTGAPPKATWGNASDPVRVGAHTSHVAGSAIAPPFDCGLCHVKPADALSVGHIDAPTATVAFSDIATKATTAAWDRNSATCATYCHGATLGGGTNTIPDWRKVGQGEAACGTCHGLPPPAPHPAVSADLAGCSVCHPLTVDGGGNLIAPSVGGKHLDGTVEAATGHDASWMEPSSPGFHAYSADRGLASCQACHGASLDGAGSAPACAGCHGPSWKTSCTMCHGGTDSQTGAPPKATWGNGSDPVRVGAHASHGAGSAIAPPFDCGVCHVKPADALAAGHIDGPTATVPFGGLGSNGGNPVWDRASASCASTYCHGATLSGGSNTTPNWTSVGQGQADCGTCHGIPPPAPHPAVATGLPGCNACHPQTIDAVGNLIAPGAGGKHLDGTIQAGHVASWMDTSSPNFHAYSAAQGLASCQLCHGPTLDGAGSAPACGDCHGAGWKTNCTTCHGGADNQTGAPPRAIWGSTSPVAIGAHSSHVAANPVSSPFACAECHVAPADALAAGHLDGTVSVQLAGPLSGLAPGATWNYPASPTCSSTYCHGNFTRGIATNAPNWTLPDQAACGTCHPARPQAYLHVKHQTSTYTVSGGAPQPVTCNQCHSGIASSTGPTGTPGLVVTAGSGPALHVNGTTDVVFQLGGTYTKEPAQGSCSSTYCHGSEVMYWPR